MNPELVSQIASAVVVAWGSFAAIRATRATTRTMLLSNLLVAVAMLLLVRLIADFGGWNSWFLYVWMLSLGGYVIAVYLAVTAWPSLSWRAENEKTRRSELTNLSVSSVLTLAVSGALVIPGLLLS
ncbi:hypothetical protein [Brevibacterium aurantiacum]|uniref:Uncharacterized protein n=1 Tax=Brevibacterium aurantiacum TaxID=273384 RepID=A0A556C2B1_BREAU|nr:hypothetical protein [Brevibacterium aurantiacum]TSI11532.1 hypothetical protein FO013_21805 [Brevibacterium aurantiacum]